MFAVILALVGAAVYVGSFLYYMALQIKGGIKPAFSTWAIWALLTIANVVTYRSVSKEWTESLNVYASVAMNCGVFLIALGSRRFKRLEKIDYIIMAGALVSLVLYVVTPPGPIPNLIVCALVYVSILPTVDGLKMGTGKEEDLPWLLFTVSYLFFIAVILVRHHVGWSIVFQAVGIIANGHVWYANRLRPR